MQIFLVHDEDGNIISVGSPAAEFEGQLRLLPEGGAMVLEIRATDLEEQGLLPPEIAGRIRNTKELPANIERRLADDFKIDVTSRKLVGKKG